MVEEVEEAVVVEGEMFLFVEGVVDDDAPCTSR